MALFGAVAPNQRGLAHPPVRATFADSPLGRPESREHPYRHASDCIVDDCEVVGADCLLGLFAMAVLSREEVLRSPCTARQPGRLGIGSGSSVHRNIGSNFHETIRQDGI